MQTKNTRLIALILLLIALITLNNRGWQPRPVHATEPPLTPLTYQPPPNATNFNDFIPPNTQTTQLTLTDSTTPLDPSQNTALQIENTLLIVSEANTFASEADTHIELSNITLQDPTTYTTTYPATNQPSPRPEQRLLHFQIEAIKTQSGAIAPFQKPVRMTVDLRSYGLNLDQIGGNFYLAYESSPGQWTEVPHTTHQPDGLISAEVTHFSNWVSGWRPEAWALEWSPPAVAEFSGSAGYSYPIMVPPGRAGLQPTLALSYNSTSLRGAIQQVSFGNIATGWSLNDITITRSKIEQGIYGPSYQNEFRLVINGSGHRLIQGNTTNGITTFYAENAPQIRVYNHGGLRWDNDTTKHTYWVVHTGDGLRYRLGYTHNHPTDTNPSVSYQRIQLNGGAYRYEAIAWHIDTITDTSGNQITYNYLNPQPERFEETQYGCPDPDYPWITVLCTLRTTTYNSQTNQINYNFTNRITTLPAPHDVTRLTNNPASQITLLYNATDNRLSEIQVAHGFANASATTPHLNRIYEIQASTVAIDNIRPQCDRRQADGTLVLRQTRTRQLDSITHTSWRKDTNSWSPLPATTFSYAHYAHFTEDSATCFVYSYLSQVQNGYGGSSTLIYESDGRQIGQFENCRNIPSNCEESYPNVGYNYRVSDITHHDGRNAPIRTHYDYSGVCYDQTDPAYNTCTQHDTTTQYGNIGGHSKVIATTYNYDNTTGLTRQISHYHQDQTLFGRPFLQLAGAPGTTSDSLIEYQRTDLTYNTVQYIPSVNFTTLSQQSQTTRDPSDGDTRTTRVVYAYDQAGYQDGQYGNLTGTYFYDSQDNLALVHHTWYVSNPTDWLVTYPYGTATFHVENEIYTFTNSSFIHYDNATLPGQPPTQGRVTRTSQAIDIPCNNIPGGGGAGCAYARQMSDSTTTYDPYGNPLTTTTYNNYSYRSYDASLNVLVDLPPTQARTTTLDYENQYNLYPVSVTNPLGHQTTFQIYGFQDHTNSHISLNGFQSQTGLLKRVTDPNLVEALYEYDPWGRLYQTYEGNPSNPIDQGGTFNRWDGLPTSRIRYWDNSWNGDYIWLDPANNEPFLISSEQRPNELYAEPLISVTYHDGLGRPIQSHNRGMNIAEVTNGLRDIVTSTSYSALGQTSCTTTPYHVAPNTFYANGFDTTPCTATDHTASTHDILGRQTTATAPDGATTTWQYDLITNITVNGDNQLSRVQITDPLGHYTTQYTNWQGNLVKVRQHTGTVGNNLAPYLDSDYTYDRDGNLLNVAQRTPTSGGTGSLLSEVSMSYDVWGRKLSMDDADMGAWTYEYDAVGNLTRQQDGNGVFLCFYYDALDRPTRKTRDGQPNDGCPTQPPSSGSNHRATYTYDTQPNGLGQPATVSWGSEPSENSDTFTYDSYGRLASQTRLINNQAFQLTTLSFDVLHRPLTVRYPDGEEVTLTYDHEGANTLTAGVDPLVTDITYNSRAQTNELSLGNNVTTTYDYYNATGTNGNSNYRLAAITVNNGTQELRQFEYAYDVIGNITRMVTTENGQTSQLDIQDFTYDALSRLKTAVGGGGSLPTYNYSYNYDPIGNMTQRGSLTYSYTPTDQPHAVKSLSDGSTFTYDNNGNMLTRNGSTGDFTHTFDVENRLVSVTNNTYDTTTAFEYDASGQRVMTRLPNNRIIYTPFPNYQEEHIPDNSSGGINALEYPPGSVIHRSTYHFNGQAVAQRQHKPIYGDTFQDNQAQGWVPDSGLWYVEDDNNDGSYMYRQAWTSGDRHSSQPVTQSGAMSYEWDINFEYNQVKASFFFYSDTPDFDHAYMVSQRANALYLFEWDIDSNGEKRWTELIKDSSATAVNGGSYDYQASYDPTSGVIQVYRNGILRLTHTDNTPLTSGSYIGLRTINTRARFDDIQANKVQLSYLHSDHLGSNSLMTNSSGAIVPNSQAAYLPFGDWRDEPATSTLTDLGYTGHRHNNTATNDLGLIYMNARYYVPGLARFASADSIVPDPSNPQAYNKYTYVYNSPLNLVDPDGHCPAPTTENGYEGNGNIICIAAFIPTKYSQGPLGLKFLGDDRWFSSNSGLDESRFWAWIDVDTGEIVGSFIHPTVTEYESEILADLFGGECEANQCTHGQPDFTFKIAVTLTPEGIIIFEYSVLCSHPTCYLGPGLDGIIAFVPNGNGSYDAIGLTEPFPNLEAYYWEQGELQDTLFNINNFSQEELDNDILNLESSYGMYGPLEYWDTLPWWRRGYLGH